MSTSAFTSASSRISASRHTSASCRAPFIWLVVAFPSALASPSRPASARRLSLSLRHSSSSHLDLLPHLSFFGWLPGASPPLPVATSLTPPSRLSSRLRSVLPLVATLSFGWLVALPDASAYHTNGCLVATRHTAASCASTPLVCDSTWRCLPPIPPPYPSRMASFSPGCGPVEGLSPSGWCTVFREHHWRWAKEPVARASCDNRVALLHAIR